MNLNSLAHTHQLTAMETAKAMAMETAKAMAMETAKATVMETVKAMENHLLHMPSQQNFGL